MIRFLKKRIGIFAAVMLQSIILRWILFIAFYMVIDFYAFQAFKTITKSKWLYIIYWLMTLVVIGNFVYHLMAFDRSSGINANVNQAIGFFLTLFAPKLLILLFMFGEDIIRLPQAFYKLVTEGNAAEGDYFPSRRKFISQVALGLAAIPFASLLYGMYRGKYNYKVLKYALEFDDLPDAFDGYQITQISDIHSGSFDNRKKIEYGVELINIQNSDIILFTGDMVNNKASEMDPWIDIFKKLEAKDGMYSVFGNHDYGDYVAWESTEAKARNLERLKSIHKEIGFDLLLNENRFLKRGDSKIALLGVENWGAGRFKKAGDLKKASGTIDDDDFKILLSHDPTHWETEVKNNDTHYHLTLSGHTHGMQFGIEIPGWFKWSPVKWRYKYWAGIYEEAGRYINVNRGFGFLAYPGRVGIWPEISVITLKKRQKDLA